MGAEANPTRESLLDSAITLFSEKGYAAVGIREIADSAGANIASIKYHFGSKNDLYLAAVNRVMTRQDGASTWNLLNDPPDEPLKAALRLARFIRMFLAHLIPPGSTTESSSSLMIREALQPGEAFDAVVDESIGPNNEKIINLLAVLSPDATHQELEQQSGSILGQVLHIRIFRPFVERLRGIDLSGERALDAIAQHITEFSLRGIGLDESLISEVLRVSSETNAELVEEGQS